jgi:LDH2 family malate/lactate/ureidoglycolate dehydrogenase
VRFEEVALREFAQTALEQLGAPPAVAARVLDSLLDSDRRGVHTHGLVRLPSYAAQVRSGDVIPDATPRLERDDGPTATASGGFGVGAPAGVFAFDHAIEAALRHGVGVVTVRDSGHFGAASYYARRAARRGLIGVTATNTPSVMAPWGGREPRIGNNPFAVVAPMPAGRPAFVLDMAQTATARGRIKLAELAGERLPLGWALDAGGEPTADPGEALAGSLLPFGGHKGYGLALAVEMFAGVLSGAKLSYELVNTGFTGGSRPDGDRPSTAVGNFHLAIEPARFGDPAAFRERLGALATLLKATPPAPGVSEVLLPGELEARSESAADRLGVGLEAAAIGLLRDYARSEGLDFPSAAARP